MPGACSSALLHVTVLQGSSLNHLDKPSVCLLKKKPLYFDIPMTWMALTSCFEEGWSNGQVAEWAKGDVEKLSACLCNSDLRNIYSKCSFCQKVPLCWNKSHLLHFQSQSGDEAGWEYQWIDSLFFFASKFWFTEKMFEIKMLTWL